MSGSSLTQCGGFRSVELIDWMLLQVASGRYETVGIASLLLRTT